MFAKEVVLLGCRQAGVTVRGSHNTEFVGIRPQALFERQTVFQGFASVFPSQHIIFFGDNHVAGNDVSEIPGFIVRELIRW